MHSRLGRVTRWFDRRPGQRAGFGFAHVPELERDVYVAQAAVVGRRAIGVGAMLRIDIDRHLVTGQYFAVSAEVLHHDDRS